MARDGLLIGEIASKTGLSRKALRLYEAVGILAPPRRTAGGYRLYTPDAVGVLGFVAQARRLGLHLDEIREIVAIQRSGSAPCSHVRDLLARKTREIERMLAEGRAVRARLRGVMRAWPRVRGRRAVVCPHIEAIHGEERRTRWKA